MSNNTYLPTYLGTYTDIVLDDAHIRPKVTPVLACPSLSQPVFHVIAGDKPVRLSVPRAQRAYGTRSLS